MNIFNKFIYKGSKQSKYFTLLTGSHLKYTQDIIAEITKQNNNLPILVLNKHYNEVAQQENITILDKLDNVNIFNCDPNNPEDIDELTYYLTTNGYKVYF
jgi:hypothetical protein